MSYQVLARKWRPRVFKEMVGQEHVLKALINALDQDRLHHAYLFTGTRGVGKTTIARILAKCLNCETGVTSEPCDQCQACVEINEGRFVDLIEVDAASRTKVEDTRELLDNVQYAPTKGRYKVYLIDEVHMLSGHSFNALLKTLEEPPPHVKFLLATTDPQKLPVTILSRCLQFNLKNMTPERIVEHLEHILQQESIPFETSALWALGRSADGSMRDALSLTDQAISYGQGKIVEDDVNAMLGTIDRTYIMDMLQALSEDNGTAILQHIDKMSEHSPDYEQALAELINIVHRIAIAQVLPESIDNTFGDREQILSLAKNFAGDDVQLFYQTALMGRRDLPLAPDPRGGFEMVMLRLLAFKPQAIPNQIEKPEGNVASPVETNHSAPTEPETIEHASVEEEQTDAVKKSEPVTNEVLQNDISKTQNANVQSAPTQVPTTEELPDSVSEQEYFDENPSPVEQFVEERPNPTEVETPESVVETNVSLEPQVANTPVTNTQVTNTNAEPINTQSLTKESEITFTLDSINEKNWNQLVRQINAAGVIGNSLSHCQLQSKADNQFNLIIDKHYATLYDPSHQARIGQTIGQYLGCEVNVAIEVGDVTAETPAAMLERLRSERLQQAIQSMKSDPLVQDVIQMFSATLQEDTVVPVDH